MKTFFIAGAPRSGTAWLSNFLTTDNSVCFHEGLKFVPVSYTHTFRETGRPICGDSGAHIPFIYKKLTEEFQNSAFVIVEREPADAKAASSRQGFDPAHTDLVFSAMAVMARDVPHLSIPYETLFTEDSARRIWEHCLGTPFDKVRWEVVSRANVQASKKSHLETATFVKSGLATTLELG